MQPFPRNFEETKLMFGYWGMGGMMWIWPLILFGCGYLFWFGYPQRRYRRYRTSRVDPMEIARRRLASGEISSSEFEEIKRTLQES